MKMQDRTAIITGGASGIGRACVDHVLQAGMSVVILDRQPMPKDFYSERVHWVHTDVSDYASVERAFQSIPEFFSDVRVVLNCAGIIYAKRLLNMEPVDFENVIRVNLMGTFYVVHQAVKYMMKLLPVEPDQERGVIINTASIAAFEGQIGQTAYSASKAGLIGMMLPMARELASVGIRVMTIAPGVVNTPLLQGLSEDVRESLAHSIPFPKRLVNTEEFARLVSHIIENTMLNGETIRLDGALRMQPK